MECRLLRSGIHAVDRTSLFWTSSNGCTLTIMIGVMIWDIICWIHASIVGSLQPSVVSYRVLCQIRQ